MSNHILDEINRVKRELEVASRASLVKPFEKAKVDALLVLLTAEAERQKAK
jgi:hypothetical protein